MSCVGVSHISHGLDLVVPILYNMFGSTASISSVHGWTSILGSLLVSQTTDRVCGQLIWCEIYAGNVPEDGLGTVIVDMVVQFEALGCFLVTIAE